MKVTLYNAISIDGFIATKDGNSDWVSEVDVPIFESEMQKAGCIILGRTTFEQFLDELYPVEGITNIVLTSDPAKARVDGNVIYTNASPQETLNMAADKGHEQALLIGGGKANAAFLEAGLIDELILSIHPLALGNGIKLFEGKEFQLNLERLSTQELGEGLVQVRYKVLP